MRHEFGWGLPPGVSDWMIEEQAGAFDEEAIEEAYISPEVSEALSGRRKGATMRRKISLRRMANGTTIMIAYVSPGTPDFRWTERILSPAKAERLQRAIYELYRQGRVELRPWGGVFIGWVALIT